MIRTFSRKPCNAYDLVAQGGDVATIGWVDALGYPVLWSFTLPQIKLST